MFHCDINSGTASQRARRGKLFELHVEQLTGAKGGAINIKRRRIYTRRDNS